MKIVEKCTICGVEFIKSCNKITCSDECRLKNRLKQKQIYYQKNRHNCLNAIKRHRRQNREKINAYRRAYYEKNADKIREYYRKYLESYTDDELKKLRDRQYELTKIRKMKNPEKFNKHINELQSKYREKNREKIRAYNREYKRKQREKNKINGGVT